MNDFFDFFFKKAPPQYPSNQNLDFTFQLRILFFKK